MIVPPSCTNEAERLQALTRYENIDLSEAIVEITRLTAAICEAPVAAVSFVGEKEQVFVANYGCDIGRTPREIAFCAHAIRSAPELLIVPDATLDPRFSGNPLVSEMNIRFYAGAPLVTPDGYALGALWVVDNVPRELTELQISALRVLSRQVISQFELKWQCAQEHAMGEERLRSAFRTAALQTAGIVESSDDAIIGEDLDGIIISWNKAAETIFGFTADEMLGHTVTPTLPEDRHREEAFLLAQIREGKQVDHFETVRRRADGSLIDISITVSPIRDAAGEVVGLSKVSRDVTARKKTESELRLFRTLIDQSTDTIDVIDPETARFLDVNESGAASRGYTREEFLKLTLFDISPDYTPDRWPAILEEVRLRGVRRGEAFHRRKDGSMMQIESTSRVVRLEREYIVSVVRDITDRVRADAALREIQEQLAIYAEHSPVAIAMFDRSMSYLIASRRWRTDFRLGDQILRGKSHYELTPDIPARWIHAHQRCLAGEVERCNEDPYVQPDGTMCWLRWETRPWRQADGEVGGIIIFSEDITKEKIATNALRTSEERLRIVTENMSEGLVVAKSTGELVYWNPAALELCGYALSSAAVDSMRLADFASTVEMFTLGQKKLAVSE